MQRNDERPPASGRPSLLSSEQQAEADRQRILSGLDGGSNPDGAGHTRGKRNYSWFAAGLAALVAIGAGSAVWLNGEGEKEIILASSVPLPATPAPAAPLASEPPAFHPEADHVSSAAILEDVPAPAPDVAPHALEASAGAAELTSLLERTEAAAPAVVASKPAQKTVPKTAQKTARKPNPRADAKNRPIAKAKSQTQHDRDVALLAALVAHSKATQPNEVSTAAEKLRQCKTLGSVAKADQCRARLCASSAKNETACKSARLTRAPDGT